MSRNRHQSPVIGMALWLLRGRSVADRVAWLAGHGFSSVSLLSIDLPVTPRKREAASAMKDAGMLITYHGNVQQNLRPDNTIDEDFIKSVVDDVLWWHENAGGIFCCCSDPILGAGQDGAVFLREQYARLMRLLAERLRPQGIRTGIENSFDEEGRLRSIADIVGFDDECRGLNIGMILDAGHTNIHVRSQEVAGENDLGQFVRDLPLDVLEVHLSDNGGVEDDHKPLGQGNLDLAALVCAVRRRGFTGPFTLEFRPGPLTDGGVADIDDPVKVEALLAARDAVLDAWERRG